MVKCIWKCVLKEIMNHLLEQLECFMGTCVVHMVFCTKIAARSKPKIVKKNDHRKINQYEIGAKPEELG